MNLTGKRADAFISLPVYRLPKDQQFPLGVPLDVVKCISQFLVFKGHKGKLYWDEHGNNPIEDEKVIGFPDGVGERLLFFHMPKGKAFINSTWREANHYHLGFVDADGNYPVIGAFQEFPFPHTELPDPWTAYRQPTWNDEKDSEHTNIVDLLSKNVVSSRSPTKKGQSSDGGSSSRSSRSSIGMQASRKRRRSHNEGVHNHGDDDHGQGHGEGYRHGDDDELPDISQTDGGVDYFDSNPANIGQERGRSCVVRSVFRIPPGACQRF